MDTKKSFIIVLIILIFGVAGVLAWKSFSGPTPSVTLSPPSDNVTEQNLRDDRRIKDITLLSEKIFTSNTKLGGYAFAANEWQNISIEENPLVLELKNNGYMDKVLKDPLPDRYYSYRSDGYTYELRAVLENKNSGKCEVSGDLCFYTVKKEIGSLSPNDTLPEDSGYISDYMGSLPPSDTLPENSGYDTDYVE